MTPQSRGRPAHFVAWLVGERVVRGCVTVISLAAVARHLAPAGFGILNYSLALIALATPLAQVGLEAILVRDLVRFPQRTGALLGTSFVIRLAVGSVLAGALVLLSHYSSAIGTAQPALGPMSIILVSQAGEVADCWFRSRVQSRVVVVIRGSIIVAGAVAKLVLVAAGAGIVAFAWVYTIEAAAFVVGIIVYGFSGLEKSPRWSFDPSLATRLCREGLGFSLAGFLAVLALRADQVAVADYLGDAAAGLYYGALRLMELPVLVATATVASLYPTLALAREDHEVHASLEAVFGIISAIAWTTALGVTIAGPWVTPLILGNAYRSAWPVLAIQGWAALFYFSGIVRDNYLALRGAPGTQAVAAGAALCVQVVSNFALVPRYGIVGAAMAFLLTQIFNAWVLPTMLPALRPCLPLQARAFFAPWKPSKWRGLIAAAGG
jgi:O-antigen/teichoic acid export membrane protein